MSQESPFSWLWGQLVPGFVLVAVAVPFLGGSLVVSAAAVGVPLVAARVFARARPG